MRIQFGMILAGTARRLGTAALPLVVMSLSVCPLMAGVDIATSAAYSGLRINTSAGPRVMNSLADVEALADWLVTYRVGETVTVTTPDGETSALVTSAASAGAVAFAPTAGGLWRLDNSSGATALFGVAWNVFNDGWTQVFSNGSILRLCTEGEGPNRKTSRKEAPPVAFSGDNWLCDASKASQLTFTSPKGVVTTLNLTGTGTMQFTFNKIGLWKVRLAMADGTTWDAEIFVRGGFTISIR